MRRGGLSRSALGAVGAVLLLLAVLVPLLWAGRYTHPFGDDYAFGVFLHDALTQGSSPLAALWYTICRYYVGWQGTFTGVAAMAVMPAVFAPEAYCLTPLVMAGALILSTGKLLHTLLCRLAGLGRATWLTVAALWPLVSLQALPSPAQGLYWWNGAAYYALFYCLLLLLLDRLLVLALPEPSVSKVRLRNLQALLLSLILSGGNYVSALMAVCFLGLHLLLLLLWDRSRWKGGLFFTLAALAGFLVNILAPGNAVRQAVSQPLSPLAAIGQSILQAGRDLFGFMSPLLAFSLLLLLPLLWDLAGRVPCSFRLPGLFWLFTFLVFAAQNAPHFYALAWAGPLRLRNIIFYSYPWLLAVDLFYLLGWVRKRLSLSLPARLLRLWTPAAALLFCLALGLTLPTSTAGQCLAALQDGSLASYHQTLCQREALLSDPALSQVAYPPLKSHPALFYLYDLDSPDPEDFPNLAARNYYHKEAVYLAPQQGQGSVSAKD
jgi:hypothetical protein